MGQRQFPLIPNLHCLNFALDTLNPTQANAIRSHSPLPTLYSLHSHDKSRHCPFSIPSTGAINRATRHSLLPIPHSLPL